MSWSPIYGDVEPAKPPRNLKVTRENPDGFVRQLQKTMNDNPPCVVCGWGFSAPVTYCPNCGSRRP